MGNLVDVQFNLLFGGLMILVVAASAVTLRLVAGGRDEPLGAAGAVALAAGGLGYALFFSAAAGWIGAGKSWRITWWIVPILAWSAASVGIAVAFDHRFWLNRPKARFSPRLIPGLLLLVWIVSVDLLMCFNPHFHGDAIQYHLTLPVYWVREGGLKPHPSIGMSGYPLLTEMLYTVPLTHALPFATRIIHLAFGVAVVLTIYGYLRDRMSAAGALAFAAAFFMFDAVNEVATWSNTDLARTFFLVGAAAYMARYVGKREARCLVVGAILAGLAMSTHYMCIVFGNGLLTLALIASGVQSRRPAREILRDLALFWLISTAVFSPWLVKNLVHYAWPLQGVQSTSFRIPSVEALSRMAGILALGLAAVAAGVLLLRTDDRGDRFLLFYLAAWLAVGPFEMPPIPRFFLPVHAVALILLGRAATPLFERHRRLELVLPAVLLLAAVAVTINNARSHLYADATRFIIHGTPPHDTIPWPR